MEEIFPELEPLHYDSNWSSPVPGACADISVKSAKKNAVSLLTIQVAC
jgi:hypothetical protein